MSEKFFYTFLLLFTFTGIQIFGADKGSLHEKIAAFFGEIFFCGMIISVICWIWS